MKRMRMQITLLDFKGSGLLDFKGSELLKCAVVSIVALVGLSIACTPAFAASGFSKPYSAPCTERENVFAFAEKPKVKLVEKDKYEITFAVTGYCDVTAAIVDTEEKVVRHLGAGVLGSNAPAPFRKNSRAQKIYWNGKDDLDVYCREPEKLKVQVMLGLKPVFDKRLGGSGPYNLPGYVGGIAIGPDGAYVIAKGQSAKGHSTIRKFDHDGRYVMTLTPPPADMPLSKLNGLGYVKYEPGKKAIHAEYAYQTVSDRGYFVPALSGAELADVQPALAGTRIFWTSGGLEAENPKKPEPCRLHYLFTDGSTDVPGMRGIPFSYTSQRYPRLAASPDGKYVYLTGGAEGRGSWPGVYRIDPGGKGPGVPFAGKFRKTKRGGYSLEPGSDNESLNNPMGVDCDARGRVYVADHANNRIQAFSSEGKYLKTIGIDRPKLVGVHQKTGAIYVLHAARVRGKSVDRLTKIASFDDPKVVYRLDDMGGTVFAVDSWTPKPRLWLAGSKTYIGVGTHGASVGGKGPSVRIFEEDGDNLKIIFDFDEEARKEAGKSWFGRWSGGCTVMNGNLECDPVREKFYYARMHVFDLKTGAYEGVFRTPYGGTPLYYPSLHGCINDIGFDKKGYMHIHWDPAHGIQGVSRVDPGQARPVANPKGSRVRADRVMFYPEVPYDYGVEHTVHHTHAPWKGLIRTKDQGGSHGFQYGLGVNMRGDIAEECSIFYIPKMEDSMRELISGHMGNRNTVDYGGLQSGSTFTYERFVQEVHEREKKGERVYFIKREPGIPLSGSTVWTFDSTGELKQECAAIAGDSINGVRLDEDGAIYFVAARPRAFDGKPFLYGKGGTLGTETRKRIQDNRYPFTGTLIKTTPGRKCKVLLSKAVVPLQTVPKRSPEVLGMDFSHGGTGVPGWVEGKEWLYAGASPIVATGCTCPVQRLHLDWYKRVYVPEAYRHSVGVLDTNGNLIMHLGRYGNFDDAPGGKNGAKPGDTDIGMFQVRMISGTDNYIVFEDWNERLVVLKTEYHAREDAAVRVQ
jgi:hypothetical protein